MGGGARFLKRNLDRNIFNAVLRFPALLGGVEDPLLPSTARDGESLLGQGKLLGAKNTDAGRETRQYWNGRCESSKNKSPVKTGEGYATGYRVHLP